MHADTTVCICSLSQSDIKKGENLMSSIMSQLFIQYIHIVVFHNTIWPYIFLLSDFALLSSLDNVVLLRTRSRD